MIKMADITLWEIYKKKLGTDKKSTDNKEESMVKGEAVTHLDKMLDAAKGQISTLTTLLTGGYWSEPLIVDSWLSNST
jgi:hypothetical protein